MRCIKLTPLTVTISICDYYLTSQNFHRASLFSTIELVVLNVNGQGLMIIYCLVSTDDLMSGASSNQYTYSFISNCSRCNTFVDFTVWLVSWNQK